MNANEIIEYYVKCVEDYNKGWNIFEDVNHVIVFFGNTNFFNYEKLRVNRVHEIVIDFVINLMSSCKHDFDYIITELNKKIPNVDKKIHQRLEVENRCDKLVQFMLKRNSWRSNYAKKLKAYPNVINYEEEPIF